VELRGLRLLTELEEACEAVFFLFFSALFVMAGGCSGVEGDGGIGGVTVRRRESFDDLVMSLRSLSSSSSVLLLPC
jgi:hypothetical protein